ncbi:MAG: hypothetical protein WA020_09510 [Candidatus Acidiferrales bacterium]
MTSESESKTRAAETVPTTELPAPTAWPLILAFGLTLLFAGLLTTMAVTVLGAVLSLAGAVGWFREVLPHQHCEEVPVREEAIQITTSRREVAQIEIAPELKRLRFPIEVYPVAAGIRGGLVGSVSMAVVAMLYGLVSHGSIWYPVNLLGAVVYAQPQEPSVAALCRFSLLLFLVALAIHLATSLLVGLLYGTMLPMLPRHPILLGGVIAPALWSGLVYAVLGIVHPLLNQRINWLWFVVSQIAFGCVAGLVVVRHSPVRVRQFLPFAIRAGVEGSGIRPEKPEDKGSP